MIDCSSSEDKIKDAAKRVFILKGFSGCTSREIARESGMNVALVNYYFRSKDKLFQIILQAVLFSYLKLAMKIACRSLVLTFLISTGLYIICIFYYGLLWNS